MPHKHTRRKGGDESNFNLAPSAVAKPLRAYGDDSNPKGKQKNARKRKQVGTENGYKHDDTPRAFARMMHLQTSKKRQRSGLDDGPGPRALKKQKIVGVKQTEATDDGKLETGTKPDAPKILPGERLGDFAARVDQAMPVVGLKRKGNVKIEGMKERQTKTEKRLHKMYAAWREEDTRYKEKLEEQKELAEDAEAEMGVTEQFETVGKGKKRKGDDDDPWQELIARREERKGLHDVVQAPPTFRAVPREKFKVKNGAKVNVENIPANAGSLKRREELSEARREIIERYRAAMGKKV